MIDSQISSNKRVRRAHRGVSLIEVLVVLVILVTGILTIIRLFPSGFFSIQSTGNAALGDSLGVAAISAGTQDSNSLPESILPGNPIANDLASATTNAAAYSNYDPDDPNTLGNARVVINETITVPSTSNDHSIYTVKYGPVFMPADPSGTVAAFPNYFTISSPNWTALSGNSAPSQIVGSTDPVDMPQDTLAPGQERFLVDLANKRIAVPYAPYTLTSSTTTPPTYSSYDQRMVVLIYGDDGKTYPQYLDVKAATNQDSANPYAPKDSNNPQGYLPDTASNYQGGWFDPTGASSPATVNYPDPSIILAQNAVPAGVKWLSVTLYRVYSGVKTNDPFGNDPYQFKLTSPNIVSNGTTGANPGAIGFNPKAAVGSGAQARKAKISYVAFSWQILHEDYDIPSLTGAGSTSVIRTTVPNLLLAGSANPDNTINSGIAGGSSSIVILDLDTGQLVAPFSSPFDPTTPDKPINNEDVSGTTTNPALINVSYSLGRLTFGSNAFGDNINRLTGMKTLDGSGTAPAHRIRVFYTADLNWTVAVQKAPAYFSEFVTSPAVSASGTTALAANQFAYNKAAASVYFARCNAGKTVEIDGIYTSGAKTQSFSDTIAVNAVLNTVGDSAVLINLNDGTKFQYPVPLGAAVTFTAVRGLSARAVVAWKERNLWKVHSVDAVLNRTP